MSQTACIDKRQPQTWMPASKSAWLPITSSVNTHVHRIIMAAHKYTSSVFCHTPDFAPSLAYIFSGEHVCGCAQCELPARKKQQKRNTKKRLAIENLAHKDNRRNGGIIEKNWFTVFWNISRTSRSCALFLCAVQAYANVLCFSMCEYKNRTYLPECTFRSTDASGAGRSWIGANKENALINAKSEYPNNRTYPHTQTQACMACTMPFRSGYIAHFASNLSKCRFLCHRWCIRCAPSRRLIYSIAESRAEAKCAYNFVSINLRHILIESQKDIAAGM